MSSERPDFTQAIDGLAWPESPRWHQGALWLSDVHNFRVLRWVPGEPAREVCKPAGRPAGLGFGPDGRLLMATALDRKLWWVSAEGEMTLALDAQSAVEGLINDLIVDRSGRAWFGDTGFDLLRGEAPRPGRLLTWRPGEPLVVAQEQVEFPNGLVIDERGTLYLAETFGRCISAFDVVGPGLLANRRIHAHLEDRPDGLCADRDGALWVALLWKQELQQLAPDGSVARRIDLAPERVISCVLGGPRRTDLFVGLCQIDDTDPKNIRRSGRVVQMTVPVPGGGVP